MKIRIWTPNFPESIPIVCNEDSHRVEGPVGACRIHRSCLTIVFLRSIALVFETQEHEFHDRLPVDDLRRQLPAGFDAHLHLRNLISSSDSWRTPPHGP